MRQPGWMLPVLGVILSFVGGNALADALPTLVDTPALTSAIAAVQPLSGVAHAGDRIVGVGRRGIIVYSDDAGAHWQQAAVPVSSDLTAVTFASPARGWAVGHLGVILTTADGGKTWTKQLDGRSVAKQLQAYSAALRQQGADPKLLEQIDPLGAAGLDQSFLDVAFLNEREGYVVGAFNLLYHTDDGGMHWQPELARTDNPRFLHLYAIRPVGNDLYIAGEQGLVLKYDRPGDRFVARPTPYQGSYFGVIGDARAVLVFGLRGNAWRSTDGGTTWQKVAAGPPVGITGGTVLGDGRWVLVDLAGATLISNDSGATFAPAPIAPAAPLAGVADAGKGKLALVGWRGIAVQPSAP